MSFMNMVYSNNELNVLEESLQLLSEVNKVVMDKATIKRRMLSRAELLVAKEEADPLYDKYVKATKIRIKTRKLIHAKYESKAKVKLKQLMIARKEKESKKKK